MRRSRRSLGIALAILAGVGVYALFTSGRGSAPGLGQVGAGRNAVPARPGVIFGTDSPTLASRPVAAAPDSREATRLEGVVLDGGTGDPVAGAVVLWGPIEAKTDADGTYRLRAEGSVPDVDEIVARAEGYVDGSTSCESQVWSPAGRLAPIFLARVRERRPGRVRDGLDRPVEGAVILVGPRNERYLSRADGSFGPVSIGDRGVAWRAFSAREGRAEGTWNRSSRGPELEVTLPVAAFVDGEVVDEAGRAVPGAEVFLLRHPDELRVASGSDGRFRWPLRAAGTELLAATTPEGEGFVEAYAGAPTRIVVRHGERLPGPSSASPPPSSDPRYGGDAERVTIRSQVVDDRGRPLPGAEVRVSEPDGSWQVFERTDADGRFAQLVYAAPVDVSISYPFGHPLGGSDWRRRVDASRTALPARIELPRRVGAAPEAEVLAPRKARVLEGRVLDAEGRPVPGADVRAPSPDAYDTTDARGGFALEGLPTDRPAQVTVRAVGTPPVQVVAAVGTASVTITLPARGSIVVLLRGAPVGGEAPRGTEVRLGTSDEARDVFLQTPNYEGGCVLDLGDRIRIDAPVGRHVLRFRRAPGAWIVFAGVEVAGGRETTLTYDFATLGRLRCVVLDPEGRPVAEATVSLAEMDSLLGYTGPDGVLVPRFDATDASVPAGLHRLRVVTDDFVPAYTEALDLRRDVEVVVRLARGESLFGDVAGPERTLTGGGSLLWRAPIGPPVVLGTIDVDGDFGPLIPLLPGRQILVLRRSGEPDVDLPLDVRPGAADAPFPLRLPSD